MSYTLTEDEQLDIMIKFKMTSTIQEIKLIEVEKVRIDWVTSLVQMEKVNESLT